MVQKNLELELKITGPTAVVSAIPGGPLMAALAPGKGHWSRLESTYFDTPDQALKTAGIALRDRTEQGKRTQTVKTGAGLARHEWETPLDKEATIPAPSNDTAIDDLLASYADRLKPTMMFSVDRWAANVHFKNAEIEIAIDLGSADIAIGEGGHGQRRWHQEPVAMIELELISGAPEALFSMAKLFLCDKALRLDTQSKKDAASAAARGQKFAIEKRKKLTASQHHTAGEVISRALVANAERIIALQAPIVDARLPAGVHQMRVELRRLRAIERACRRALPGSSLRRLTDQARLFSKVIGTARDWDVFLDETLPQAAAHDYAEAGFDRLRQQAQSCRAQAWADTLMITASDEFKSFALDLLAAAHKTPALDVTAHAFSRKTLERALRKTKQTAAQIDLTDPGARHPLRIALKKLRYGVQIFRDLYPKETRKPYMTAMSALQDSFGEMNDAVVAQELASRAAAMGGDQAMRAAGFVTGFYAARADAAALDVDAAWTDFERQPPFWRE